MKILAIDTSTEACSAALLIDGEVRERYEVAPRAHTRLILPMIDDLLKEADLKPNGLDAVAFGRGPGAFTGLRIAAGVIQGIAFAVDLPVVPVSSLASLALGGHRLFGASRMLAAIDARIREVYWAAYQLDVAGQPTAVAGERVCSPEDVPIPEGGDWFGVGSAWDTYLTQLGQRLDDRLGGWEARCYPRAYDVAVLGATAFARGETVSAEQALPVYLRNEVAVKQSGT